MTASPSVPEPSGPITADAVITHLLREGLLDEARLVELLGADRHTRNLNKLELALVSAGVLSDGRLAEIKGALTGRPILDDPAVRPLPILAAEAARSAGALALDTSPPSVAFVEDTAANIATVAATLRRQDFGVVLITAAQFTKLYKIAYSGEQTDARPKPGDIYELFDELLSRDGSDLHLSATVPPYVRVGGELATLNYQPLDADWLRDQIRGLVGDRGFEKFTVDWDVDGAKSFGDGVRFRLNVGADRNGPTLALRKLPSKIPAMEELGLPRAIREMTTLERGLVLVTGPTGSGKTTTLAALLAYMARNMPHHMITLEDPIEFIIPSGKSIVQQRQMGESFTTFASALRQSLRQDPDVILVGEARDRETIEAAVTAAETGALVFTTLHTYDAASTLSRVINTYPEGEQEAVRAQLAHVLRGVVSQTLVRASDGGRVAAFEILIGNHAVAANLRKPDGQGQLRQIMSTSAADGMQTLEMHLAQLVRANKISEIDARYKARNMGDFDRALDAGPRG